VKLNALQTKLEEQESTNRRNVLEFAELGEKMRRTYLRLSRIVKIDSQQSSEPENENHQETEETLSPKDIRERINREIGI